MSGGGVLVDSETISLGKDPVPVSGISAALHSNVDLALLNLRSSANQQIYQLPVQDLSPEKSFLSPLRHSHQTLVPGFYAHRLWWQTKLQKHYSRLKLMREGKPLELLRHRVPNLRLSAKGQIYRIPVQDLSPEKPFRNRLKHRHQTLVPRFYAHGL